MKFLFVNIHSTLAFKYLHTGISTNTSTLKFSFAEVSTICKFSSRANYRPSSTETTLYFSKSCFVATRIWIELGGQY